MHLEAIAICLLFSLVSAVRPRVQLVAILPVQHGEREQTRYSNHSLNTADVWRNASSRDRPSSGAASPESSPIVFGVHSKQVTFSRALPRRLERPAIRQDTNLAFRRHIEGTAANASMLISVNQIGHLRNNSRSFDDQLTDVSPAPRQKRGQNLSEFEECKPISDGWSGKWSEKNLFTCAALLKKGIKHEMYGQVRILLAKGTSPVDEKNRESPTPRDLAAEKVRDTPGARNLPLKVLKLLDAYINARVVRGALRRPLLSDICRTKLDKEMKTSVRRGWMGATLELIGEGAWNGMGWRRQIGLLDFDKRHQNTLCTKHRQISMHSLLFRQQVIALVVHLYQHAEQPLRDLVGPDAQNWQAFAGGRHYRRGKTECGTGPLPNRNASISFTQRVSRLKWLLKRTNKIKPDLQWWTAFGGLRETLSRVIEDSTHRPGRLGVDSRTDIAKAATGFVPLVQTVLDLSLASATTRYALDPCQCLQWIDAGAEPLFLIDSLTGSRSVMTTGVFKMPGISFHTLASLLQPLQNSACKTEVTARFVKQLLNFTCDYHYYYYVSESNRGGGEFVRAIFMDWPEWHEQVELQKVYAFYVKPSPTPFGSASPRRVALREVAQDNTRAWTDNMDAHWVDFFHRQTHNYRLLAWIEVAENQLQTATQVIFMAPEDITGQTIEFRNKLSKALKNLMGCLEAGVSPVSLDSDGISALQVGRGCSKDFAAGREHSGCLVSSKASPSAAFNGSLEPFPRTLLNRARYSLERAFFTKAISARKLLDTELKDVVVADTDTPGRERCILNSTRVDFTAETLEAHIKTMQVYLFFMHDFQEDELEKYDLEFQDKAYWKSSYPTLPDCGDTTMQKIWSEFQSLHSSILQTPYCGEHKSQFFMFYAHDVAFPLVTTQEFKDRGSWYCFQHAMANYRACPEPITSNSICQRFIDHFPVLQRQRWLDGALLDAIKDIGDGAGTERPKRDLLRDLMRYLSLGAGALRPESTGSVGLGAGALSLPESLWASSQQHGTLITAISVQHDIAGTLRQERRTDSPGLVPFILALIEHEKSANLGAEFLDKDSQHSLCARDVAGIGMTPIFSAVSLCIEYNDATVLKALLATAVCYPFQRDNNRTSPVMTVLKSIDEAPICANTLLNVVSPSGYKSALQHLSQKEFHGKEFHQDIINLDIAFYLDVFAKGTLEVDLLAQLTARDRSGRNFFEHCAAKNLLQVYAQTFDHDSVFNILLASGEPLVAVVTTWINQQLTMTAGFRDAITRGWVDVFHKASLRVLQTLPYLTNLSVESAAKVFRCARSESNSCLYTILDFPPAPDSLAASLSSFAEQVIEGGRSVTAAETLAFESIIKYATWHAEALGERYFESIISMKGVMTESRRNRWRVHGILSEPKDVNHLLGTFERLASRHHADPELERLSKHWLSIVHVAGLHHTSLHHAIGRSITNEDDAVVAVTELLQRAGERPPRVDLREELQQNQTDGSFFDVCMSRRFYQVCSMVFTNTDVWKRAPRKSLAKFAEMYLDAAMIPGPAWDLSKFTHMLGLWHNTSVQILKLIPDLITSKYEALSMSDADFFEALSMFKCIRSPKCLTRQSDLTFPDSANGIQDDLGVSFRVLNVAMQTLAKKTEQRRSLCWKMAEECAAVFEFVGKTYEVCVQPAYGFSPWCSHKAVFAVGSSEYSPCIDVCSLNHAGSVFGAMMGDNMRRSVKLLTWPSWMLHYSEFRAKVGEEQSLWQERPLLTSKAAQQFNNQLRDFRVGIDEVAPMADSSFFLLRQGGEMVRSISYALNVRTRAQSMSVVRGDLLKAISKSGLLHVDARLQRLSVMSASSAFATATASFVFDLLYVSWRSNSWKKTVGIGRSLSKVQLKQWNARSSHTYFFVLMSILSLIFVICVLVRFSRWFELASFVTMATFPRFSFWFCKTFRFFSDQQPVQMDIARAARWSMRVPLWQVGLAQVFVSLSMAAVVAAPSLMRLFTGNYLIVYSNTTPAYFQQFLDDNTVCLPALRVSCLDSMLIFEAIFSATFVLLLLECTKDIAELTCVLVRRMRALWEFTVDFPHSILTSPTEYRLWLACRDRLLWLLDAELLPVCDQLEAIFINILMSSFALAAIAIGEEDLYGKWQKNGFILVSVYLCSFVVIFLFLLGLCAGANHCMDLSWKRFIRETKRFETATVRMSEPAADFLDRILKCLGQQGSIGMRSSTFVPGLVPSAVLLTLTCRLDPEGATESAKAARAVAIASGFGDSFGDSAELKLYASPNPSFSEGPHPKKRSAFEMMVSQRLLLLTSLITDVRVRSESYVHIFNQPITLNIVAGLCISLVTVALEKVMRAFMA